MLNNSHRFTFMADVAGDATEKGVFKGVASSTSTDRRRQALSPDALVGMSAQVNIPLTSGTDHLGSVMSVEAEIGTVSSFALSDDGQQLLFEGKLDPTHPMYEFYCGKLDPECEFAHDYKVSIGGWVPKDAVQRVFKAGEGQIETLGAFRLDHLLFCRADSAVNQDTMIMGMADPGDWKGALFGAAASDVEPTTTEGTVAETVTPPEVSDLWSQIHFLLDRLERSQPDDPSVYIRNIFADGTLLYEKYDKETYNCRVYLRKWSLDGETVVLTDATEVEMHTRTVYTTPDGAEIDVFKAGFSRPESVAILPPPSLDGEGDGGGTKMQENTPNVSGMAKLLAGLLEVFTGKSVDETVVAGTAAEAADAAVVDAEPEGKADGAADAVVEPSIADQVAAGVTAGLQPLMDVISALTPAAAVDGMADASATADADDTGEAAATADESATVEEAAATADAAVADEAAATVEEPVVPSLTGMSDEDAANFNQLFGTLLTGMNTLTALVQAQGAEIDNLKLVGKADGASTQVSPAGTTPANVARADRSVGIQGFVTGNP